MPAHDSFQDFSSGLTGPICGGFDIVPDDSAELAQVTRAIMVAQTGDLAVLMKNGDTLTLTGLMAGVMYPLRICQVRATGTTASGIVGLV